MFDTNPVTAPSADGLGVFGKAKSKLSSRRVLDLLKQLQGGQEEDEEGLDMKSTLSGSRPKAMRDIPAYDPNTYYGGAYRMYGGRRFRGGLLGE